jgi:glycosyltransferase involved in cell wall biosynthesis
MKNKALVSIFLPVYNAEKFIAETIETSINQSYENVELVISDDASKDGTWDIITYYKDKFPDKIKAYRQDVNLGVTKNCNFILEKCEGQYICFSAGDDVLAPECIRRAVEIVESNENVGIVFHKFQRIDESSVVIPSESDMLPHFGVFTDFLKKGVYCMANGMLVNRAANPEIRYNIELTHASDQEFILDILKFKNFRFYYTAEVNAFWRFNTQSITNTKVLHTLTDAFISNYNLTLKYPEYAFYIKNQLFNYLYHFRLNKFINSSEYYFYKFLFSFSGDNLLIRKMHKGFITKIKNSDKD